MTKHVTAHLRFLRIAPRKVRLVLGLIRGKSLELAEQQLAVLPKGSSLPILKLLKSAQANAVHNFKLDPKSLYIAQAYANEGPKLKRYMPHAMGRATVILKRMSHVTVVLAPMSEMPKTKTSNRHAKAVAASVNAKASKAKVAKVPAKKPTAKVAPVKSEESQPKEKK